MNVDDFISETHELVSWMKGQDSAIQSISVHASGRYAVTSSNSVAQLWDLDTFSRKRTLNGAQTVGIQQVLINIKWCKQILRNVHVLTLSLPRSK